MKHKWFNKALSAVLALVMCIGMLPAVATPAAADEVQSVALGSNEWVIRNDDFSRYETGVDTFWKNSWYTGFSNGYHGTYGSDTYATYDIVEENGNKVLQLVSMNSTSCNFYLPAVTGAYSMSVDFCMKKTTPSVPGLVMNLFDFTSSGIPRASVYIDGTHTFRLMERFTTTTDTTQTIKKADGTELTAVYDTWFTVKLSVEPGKFVFKAWPRGEQEPADTASAGVIVIESDAITEQALNKSMSATIQSRSRNYEGVAHTVLLDNLKITKPYDSVTLPTALQGAAGERIGIPASFTGQDLYAQVPAPRFSYTLSDPKLGYVAPDGYLILGQEGQGTVTVAATDMDGKASGQTWTIPVTVTAATQSAQPLRILSIGNGYSRDTLYYLGHLAKLVGQKVEFGYLYQEDATLRYHAHNVAMKTADYSYYVSDPDTGVVTQAAAVSTINEVVNSQNWDIVMLQQGGAAVGMNNTFAGDLRYLLDYLADAQPNAKVYWNMNAAEQQDTADSDTVGREILDNYYDGKQNVMYNAIVGSLEMAIVGENARYADDFDGWFPVGAAIQNLRATSMGDNLTRDGYQLSLQAGRLAAAMTVLKVLFPSADLSKITPDAVSAFLVTDKTDEGTTFSKDPDYTNDAANMALIRQSVEAACANLSKAPAKLATTIPTIESSTKDPNDVTVGQTDAPLALRFADIVVTEDGTIYAGAYEAVTHVPARGKLPYTEYCPEGYGRLKIWKSTDNGKTWDFDNPILTIDQQELQDWGISPNLYNRYEMLKTGVQDYAFFNDARDANLGLMYYDMDGNGTEDEVLMFTFFCNDYNESGSSTFTGTHLMFSIDGGKTWSQPQRIMSSLFGNGGGKRGDMAVFSNGQILFPMYSNPRVCGVLLQWNVKTQHWDTIAESEIEMYIPTTEFTEPSFIAPDPDGDVVYGFVRDNGQAVISYDRGRTWEWIHTIDGNVQQPGWAYIDQNRAFATWSFNNGGTRPTKGQMVYFDAGWEATQPLVVHPHYNPVGRDTGDPSAKLLANGKLLTITYDTYFRAINGRFLDPNAPEFQLPEMYSGAAEKTLCEVEAPTATMTVGENLPYSHTVNATATFAAGGKLTITAANGAKVEFAVGKDGVRANKATELRVAVVNGVTYTKVWAADSAEPADWTAVTGGTSQNSGKAVFDGSAVTLSNVKITRRATLRIEAGSEVIAGMSEQATVTVNPADMADEVVWNSSNPVIATVNEQGKIVFKSEGIVTITATIGDKSVSTEYEVVGSLPDEVAGVGDTRTIFTDDFEDYTVGTDAFLSQMVNHGYDKLYSSNSKVMTTGYHIVQENGNKYLELVGENGKYAWCVVDTPINGDYTVQFDFYHGAESAGKGTTFLNLWHGAGIYAMVQIGTDGFQVQHIDSETGLYMNSKGFDSHDVDAWYTMKVARVDGGVYAKVWLQGTPEPEQWQYCALADEMTTNNTATGFRFSSAAGDNETRSVRIDNLIITKQKVPNPTGTNEWVVRSDDFNDRTVGKDTFWQDAKYSGFSESNHKKEPGWLESLLGGSSDYSYYGIVEENGNKAVELTTGKALNNVFTTTTVKGAYSTTVDVYMKTPTGTSVPGIVIDLFYGTTLSGKAAVYIDGGDGVRFLESLTTGSSVSRYVNGSNGSKMPFKLDTWYTIKTIVEPGQITLKAWPQGGQEPDGTAGGVLVLENDAITATILNKGAATSFQTRTREDKAAYVVRLDNLTISKPYKELKLPAKLAGEPGEKVTLKPSFSGQDLLSLTPAPTIKYTSTNPAVATVTSIGVVTYVGEGQATIQVELPDIDGKIHGIAKEIPVTVVEVVEPEPEPEPDPEPDPEPVYPDHLGYFGIEVIKTIEVNGEKIDICRWVWTPFNKR